MSMNHGCLLIFGKLRKIGTKYKHILQYLRSQQMNMMKETRNSNKIRKKKFEIEGLECKQS